MDCQTAMENVDDACEPRTDLPALDCDSGHRSDYCYCE
jgi:hypothetical protein